MFRSIIFFVKERLRRGVHWFRLSFKTDLAGTSVCYREGSMNRSCAFNGRVSTQDSRFSFSYFDV